MKKNIENTVVTINQSDMSIQVKNNLETHAYKMLSSKSARLIALEERTAKFVSTDARRLMQPVIKETKDSINIIKKLLSLPKSK